MAQVISNIFSWNQSSNVGKDDNTTGRNSPLNQENFAFI